MRHFLRLINQAARAFSNLDTMTVEKAESFNKRMTELCARDYEWRNSSRNANVTPRKAARKGQGYVKGVF